MSQTEEYVRVLAGLKAGDLGLLRTHAGQGLDQSVEGFDLFAGLWWPLRAKSQRAPRRSVAWLAAKLYASAPLPHTPGRTLARQLRRANIGAARGEKSLRDRYDQMLQLPLEHAEPALRWAVGVLASNGMGVDWVRLIDDLSRWEEETVRLRWAEDYIGMNERG